MEPKEIEDASGLTAVRYGRGILLGPPGQCGCGFASGDSPDSAGWHVAADLQKPLIAAVNAAASRMRRFRLQASWMDDPPRTEITTTVIELTERISHGVIANHSFIVRGS